MVAIGKTQKDQPEYIWGLLIENLLYKRIPGHQSVPELNVEFSLSGDNA